MLAALARVKVPRPSLVRPKPAAASAITPPNESVVCGAATVIEAPCCSVMAPVVWVRLNRPSKRSRPEPPLAKVSGFVIVWAEVAKRRTAVWAVCPSILRVPVPSAAAAPMSNPPPCRSTPPLKVFVPVSCRTPLPVLVRPFAFWITAPMVRVACSGATTVVVDVVGSVT